MDKANQTREQFESTLTPKPYSDETLMELAQHQAKGSFPPDMAIVAIQSSKEFQEQCTDATRKMLGKEPIVMYGNYQYSLDSQQQSSIQLFLRFLPAKYQDNPVWQLLHSLTYAQSWTQDKPLYEEVDD